jgi:transketolase
MRKQFVATIERLSKADSNLITLLGDIGVYGFRNVFSEYKNRIYNLGICEQSMASMAAGLAKEGFIPVVHSIAPFVVERCYEQIKCDICYQKLGVNIVSVGASYDYAALGSTHHCPGDISILSSLPGMEIVVPGNPNEFDQLFRQSYANNNPTYYRLSEISNKISRDINFGKANVIRKGKLGTIIIFGPAFDWLPDLVFEWDISLLYYTTVHPFDYAALIENTVNEKIIIIEPYYTGSINQQVSSALKDKAIKIHNIGVPMRFLTNYGTRMEHDKALGLTKKQLGNQLRRIIYE